MSMINAEVPLTPDERDRVKALAARDGRTLRETYRSLILGGLNVVEALEESRAEAAKVKVATKVPRIPSKAPEALPPEDHLMPCVTCPGCGRDSLLYDRVKGVTYVYCDSERTNRGSRFGCKFKPMTKDAWIAQHVRT